MTVGLASGTVQLDGGYRNGSAAVRVRAGITLDPYSQASGPDWTTATEVTLTRVAFAPVSSTDALSNNGRWVDSTHALWSRNIDLDVQPTDRIRYRGVTWEVTGEGARWQSPFTGWEAGAVFGLRAIT